MKKRYWSTKEGEEIEYTKIEDRHLLNILNWIERIAEKGLTMQWGGGGWDIEDMWYEEETIYGDDVKRHYDFKNLAKEALRRGLLTEKEYLLRV